MTTLNFIKAWGGLNPGLPEIDEVEDPKNGQKARNSRGQKVVYDAEQGKWVMPQNFTGKPPVTITAHGYIYTEFGIFAEDDTGLNHPLTLDDVVAIRNAEGAQEGA